MSMNELTVKLTPFVATIPELTPDMVAEAKRKAKQAIIDQQVKPKRSDFDDVVISRYPPRLVRFTVFVLVTLFLTSIIPSAFHIFEVATSYPKTAINSASILSGFMNIAQHSISWQKAIIGICTVIGSEMAVMGLAIASQVFFDGNKDMQRLFNVPIVRRFLPCSTWGVKNSSAMMRNGGQVIIISRPPSDYPVLKARVLCDSPYQVVMSSDALVYGDLSHE